MQYQHSAPDAYGQTAFEEDGTLYPAQMMSSYGQMQPQQMMMPPPPQPFGQFPFGGDAAGSMYPPGPSHALAYTTSPPPPGPTGLASPPPDPVRFSQSPQQSAPPPAPLTPHSFPMAAPGLSPFPANNNTSTPQSQQQNNAGASPLSPPSPGPPGREQQRIALLLDINAALIQRLSDLQAQSQGGAITPQQAMQLRAEGKPDKMASDEFIQVLKRLQANLTYLTPNKTPEQLAKAPPGPMFMSPPPQMPALQPQYDQLKELFPGWPGLENMRAAANAASPRNANMPHGANGTMAPPQQQQ